MDRPLERLKPIGFWSYARQDDEMSDGALEGLRRFLLKELQQAYGKAKVRLWQDVAAIPPGAEWERMINEAVDQSTFLIPIITPTYLESEFCCFELTRFKARQEALRAQYPALKGRSLIFPIRYIDTDGRIPYDPAAVEVLEKLQYIDLRTARREEDEAAMRRALRRLADEVKDLLLLEMPRPPTAEEIAASEHQGQEAARQAAEAKRLEDEAAAETKRLAEEKTARRQEERARRAAELKAATRVVRERADEERRIAEANGREKKARGKDAAERRRDQIIAWVKAHPRSLIGVALVVLALLGYLTRRPDDASSPPNPNANAARQQGTANQPELPAAAESDDLKRIEGEWVRAGHMNYCGTRHAVKITVSGVDVTVSDGAGTRPYTVRRTDAQGWRSFDGALWRIESGKLVQKADSGETQYKKCRA